jgi:hypothetical protein
VQLIEDEREKKKGGGGGNNVHETNPKRVACVGNATPPAPSTCAQCVYATLEYLTLTCVAFAQKRTQKKGQGGAAKTNVCNHVAVYKW